MRHLLRLELIRLRRDPVLALIVVVLPVFLYAGFILVVPEHAVGTTDRLRTDLLVGLACYGAATGAANLAGQAALERVHGWGRQLALTPLPTAAHLAVKACVALVASSVSVTLTFLVGALSGAGAAPLGWVLAWLVVVGGSVVWAAYGLLVGLAFRSESAVAAGAAGLVLLSFLGGLFVPLPADLSALARWTPLHGYATLGRAALGLGRAPLSPAEIAWAAVSLLVWGVLLWAGAARLIIRSRARG